MEELQSELIGLMKTADIFNGVHTQVYKLGIFSDDYIRKIRNGERNFKDTPENRNKVHQLIIAYESKLHKLSKQLR